MNAPITIWRAKVQGGHLVPLPRKEDARQRIFALQDAAQRAISAGAAAADCPLQHSFIDGVYVRTIFIPAGTAIVGKIHKHSHANVLSQGHVTVYTEGGGLEDLHGPLTMTSPAGCKRAVYAHTDTTWTTIHATDETDLDRIEDWVIAPDYGSFEAFALEMRNMKLLEVMQ